MEAPGYERGETGKGKKGGKNPPDMKMGVPGALLDGNPP
ncbi:hypothetical protein G1C98_0001 [Bifidobacterium sp. DSM 109960]|uniref:Uncharacterized protein n=1 Tax=Bifidobacterium erythrocebi TaxID=2675325 RepID=A0A7Y0HSK4_9BIFI|nr:hypothetical protein [Bifidobacterium sp. DSM 109960]